MAALTTSKRKFHKILENITASSSTTSLASLREKNASAMSVVGAQKEPPPKRSRTSFDGSEASNDRPDTAASASLSRPTSQANLSLAQRAKSVRLVRAKAKEDAETRKAPNYAPWSHELFVERMKSFADVKLWAPKPDKLSEVEWAKRGWTCEGVNTVACKGGCEQRIVVKLEPKRKEQEHNELERDEAPDEEVDEALVERYAPLIVEGHGEGCLWRKGGCKADIYHVPMANYDDHIKPGLMDRHKSLLSVRYQLPTLDHIQYPGTKPDRLAKALPEELTQPLSSENVETTSPDGSTDQTHIEKRIQLFALYGWHGEDRGKYSIVRCGECHQRTGLWLYSAEDSKLDLAEGHRIHCPWLNPESQGGHPIWEQLQARLISRAREASDSITISSEVQSIDMRPPSSAADSEQADKKRMNRLRKAMKSFGGKLKK